MLLLGGIVNKVVTAYSFKRYAGMSNRVSIQDNQGERFAYIVPPAWVFGLAASVAKAHPRQLDWYLQQVDKNKWLFGIERNDKDWFVDLIQWRKSELPYWATEEYQDNLKNNTECSLGDIPKGKYISFTKGG